MPPQTRRKNSLSFGSLFAGIGGMDLGLERAGLVCKWQVEKDPFCRRVLAKHWPTVTRFGDITELNGNELEPVDVICGGFPCQPFSSASAGRGRGVKDDRYLWPEMLRIINSLRPTWVIGENVTHLDRGPLDAVVSDLEASGYEVAPPFEIPACAFGYDHWRPRLWILGYSHGNSKSSGSIDAKASRLSGDSCQSCRMGEKDGVPAGLDGRRLKALGNAVIPDIPEWLGRHIMAASGVDSNG